MGVERRARSSAGRRLVEAAAILALFGLGIWGLSSVIADDAPRLDPAYRFAIWVGEASLALFLLRWIIFGTGQETQSARVLLGLLLSLAVDVGVTSYGYVCEYAGHARSVEATATIRGLRSVESRSIFGSAVTKRRHRVVLSFEDARGRPHDPRLPGLRLVP